MSDSPQFGLVLSNRNIVTGNSTVSELIQLAQKAEAAGWGSIWVGDSIFAKPRLDALMLLSALAVSTQRVKLGPASFTSTPLRNPLQLAYQWFSLDVLSGGRTIFNASQGAGGAGGGAFAEEFATFQIDPATRMRRMEEAIDIMRLTASQERASYEGEYTSFQDVTVLPRPVQRSLPIWISTATDPRKPKMTARALQRVARYADGWMTLNRPPELFADNLADIRRYAREMGREPGPDFVASLYLDVNLRDDEQVAFRESKEFLDDYYMYNFSRAEVERRTIFGPPQVCIERLQRYVDAGVTWFVLRIIGPEEPLQLQRLTEEVLPAFRKGAIENEITGLAQREGASLRRL
ncbi:alkanesulfonate monooxygenase SsuD/methylene tetrahydromethanopterin reductase-like flavin-dependent oxidoreductase (luciferase family) [Thermosporothrix hazakensis]|uniref:Alkanesulfonate monooxygenase SsuD/methylene tetrahydromethanopterin reductase-like flavin-dependent oxidoreductase (Luciferase family) n=2 Tax=Thermosporothrix TaxID=768650 RepID=A0A326U045_THEHA|nr:LLM class flavin-dependent oxidoreductase [Thermosporothrix hazakensis]PZW22508.1 alkanesulfonate monooxygenase SsuD/methylene tetrahydromethanopterin reductase-like flavin-dependent oxidoreductase (luciferase family) [Thermosporothrix hazakensis]BBH87761.1 N5,N10-methylene tetrahydromethanopterin reductase [Thermosporothrix sp. COM3]GCE50197.1 N5,N10-methylene tetrahydromethanopterin reductase [Thermosporothrix hazakensis]